MSNIDKIKEDAAIVGRKTVEVVKAGASKTGEAAKAVGTKINETISATKQRVAVEQIKKQIGDLVWLEYQDGAKFSESITALLETMKERLNAGEDADTKTEEDDEA
ncbi:MAG: hypothetical protein IKN24_02575 [Lachnospiraceae bacterium]|nr:hypothetical protein [Lachnospiraceae bacterium]